MSMFVYTLLWTTTTFSCRRRGSVIVIFAISYEPDTKTSPDNVIQTLVDSIQKNKGKFGSHEADVDSIKIYAGER